MQEASAKACSGDSQQGRSKLLPPRPNVTVLRQSGHTFNLFCAFSALLASVVLDRTIFLGRIVVPGMKAPRRSVTRDPLIPLSQLDSFNLGRVRTAECLSLSGVFGPQSFNARTKGPFG